jgi:hypothetical protein
MLDHNLPSPGLIPNGPRLRQEAAKAISYVETVAALKGGKTEQAATLKAFLDGCNTAINGFRDTTVPTFVSASIAADKPKELRIKYSEGLTPDVVPATSAFVTSPAKTISSVAIVGTEVVLTVSVGFAAGAVTVTYTQPGTNGTRDTSGNLVATHGPSTVTNGVV